MTILNASAQEVDSSQVQSSPVSIESLSLKLDKLQHDYDYIYCDYELHMLMMDLKDLSHSIGRSSNAVIINYYNGRYDRDLYNSYVVEYESACNLFDSMKDKVEVVQRAVTLKITVSSFTDAELNVLSSYFDVIDASIANVEKGLNYYNVTIKAYRSKR